VSAREDTQGDKRLVAYLVPEEGAELSVAQLRAQLASVLAEYMIPTAFVTLPALPLSSNGKLDRSALPSPDMDSYSAQAHEAPIGEIEIIIAAIWRELLQLDRVGRQANFFEIGGHSLLANKLTLRFEKEFNVTFPLIEVFQYPTLRAMAMAVSEIQLSRFAASEISHATAKFA